LPDRPLAAEFEPALVCVMLNVAMAKPVSRIIARRDSLLREK
jgi:hypothetical protein